MTDNFTRNAADVEKFSDKINENSKNLKRMVKTMDEYIKRDEVEDELHTVIPADKDGET